MTIDHTLTYTLDGATVVEVVQADDTPDGAMSVALARCVAVGGVFVSITVVDPAVALREAGIAKLVLLGLTEDQARAIAGSGA